MAASASFCSWTFVLVCILPVGPIRSSPTRIVTSSQTPSSSAVVAGATDEGGAGAAVNSNLVSEYPQSAPYEGPAEAIRKMREMLGRVETEDSRGLKRIFLSKDNVTCNDGSPAGFYIRKSPSSKKWIIFLEGGWYCYDQRSCQNRWLRLRNFMTSKQWAETRNVGGILSQNPEENPYWWNANHIFVPYCSSDSWSGTRPQPHRWHHHPEGTVKYAFMGSYIVQEVIKDLLPLGLAQATTLILAGSSAGGTGVIVNLDRVADNLAELGHGNIDVRGLADSGWFLDNAPYSSISSPPSSTFASSWLVTSPAQAVKKGVELWRGNVPDRCRQDYPDEIWRCYFGYRVYPTLKAPLFVFQWLFDEAQMTADNVGAPVTKEQWDYIHRTGDTLRKTFENVTGLFAASCISHTVLTKRDWQTIRLGDATLPQTLHCWEMHLLRLRKGKDPRDSHHPGHYGVSSHHHKHQHHRQHHNGHVSYMQAPPQKEGRPGKTMNDKTADFPQAMHPKGKNVTVELIWRQDPREPILSYTGNKEVTVSTWDPLSFSTGSENTTMLGDAPISSTMRYMKNAKSGANKAQVSTTSTSLAPSYPVISTPASVMFNSRLFSRKQRGGKESELAERELSGVKGGRENKGEERKHRRKEKRKRRRRRRRRKKKKTEEGGEEDEEEKGEEGSREAEGGTKHRKGGRANRRGEGQRGRRRNGGRASGRVRRSEFSSGRVQWLKEEDGNESSMRESDARGQRGRGGGNHCSYRLMERCTWPQCNHSCPKLHNPFTGEEMDFIELLKSFGLDMMSVANALGIDIHTLNNMDHDELLNLLTQQSN